MRLSKKEQVAQRRAAVLELSSQGLTQQEISDRLKGIQNISQRTISRDLEWLDRNAIEYVKRNREQMAVEYRKAMSNFSQLRKKAWEQFNKADNEGDKDDLKVNLYSILQSINNDIMNLMAAGDIIEAELIKHANEQAKEIREEMDKVLEQRIKSQAIF